VLDASIRPLAVALPLVLPLLLPVAPPPLLPLLPLLSLLLYCRKHPGSPLQAVW